VVLLLEMLILMIPHVRNIFGTSSDGVEYTLMMVVIAGVANYEILYFPDTSTIKLETNTGSTQN
jgi:hypothetical protein